MGTGVKTATLTLSIFALLLIGTTQVASSDIDPQFHSSLDKFSKNIFSELFKTKGSKNIIISPFSIQTCLAMVRMGAEGQTAVEMDQGLSFAGQSAESVADNYHTLLATYANGDILKIANKVYVMKGQELQDKYNEIVATKFFSSAENIDFGKSIMAAETINSWIELKTDSAIKDLVKPPSLSSDTRLMLLSAIYFKGNWQQPFNAKNTQEDDFYTDETESVKVQMMYRQGMIMYSKINELDATAVRLPYKDSDLSMMIILPNSRTGLATLEEKLSNFTLETLSGKLQHIRGVRLYLPKFKADFEIELNESLQRLGMEQMFSQANLGKMLKAHDPLKVSKVVHKAFIDVNEVGTTAAAVTKAAVMTRSRPQIFKADHPFYYVIMNEQAVPLFQGTFMGLSI